MKSSDNARPWWYRRVRARTVALRFWSNGLRRTVKVRPMVRVCLGNILILAVAAPAWASDDVQSASNGILAHLTTAKRHINVGAPIWVQFLIENASDEQVPLLVAGTEPQDDPDVQGLPLAHVFSGDAYSALTIQNEDQRTWTVATNYHPPARAPVVMLAEHASIGITLDVRRYYPALRSPGIYRLKWSPYGGVVESNVLMIRVAPLKQAEIITDFGEMKVRFFYDDAPNTVDNFIELAQKRFYDNLSFHRILSGFCIQGGCPNNDGTGIRPDGIKLESEISGRHQRRGMVSMSLLDDDLDSASCQFFITNTTVPEWDGKYTIFGELADEDSFATLDRLMATATDQTGRPIDKVYIRSIRITDAPPDDQDSQTNR